MSAHSPVKIHLAEVLHRHRLTQKQLAEAAHMRSATINAIYQGRVERLELNTLAGLVTGLRRLGADVNVGDLLEVTEQQDETALWDAASAADLERALDELEADEDPEDLHAWLAAFEQAAR